MAERTWSPFALYSLLREIWKKGRVRVRALPEQPHSSLTSRLDLTETRVKPAFDPRSGLLDVRGGAY